MSAAVATTVTRAVDDHAEDEWSSDSVYDEYGADYDEYGSDYASSVDSEEDEERKIERDAKKEKREASARKYEEQERKDIQETIQNPGPFERRRELLLYWIQGENYARQLVGDMEHVWRFTVDWFAAPRDRFWLEEPDRMDSDAVRIGRATEDD